MGPDRELMLRKLAPNLIATMAFAGLVVLLLWWRNSRDGTDEGGLAGRYFPNASFREPAYLTRTDARIDLWPGNDAETASSQGLTVEWTGSIWLPRGGPYKFGLEADASAELWLDGESILAAHSAGPIEIRRKLYLAGSHAIRVHYQKGQRPGWVRMTWLPPGRRGDMEYVPPSVLSPEPPERASFGDHRGAYPFDAQTAWLIVVLMVGWLAFLARRALQDWVGRLRDDPDARLTAAALITVFVVALVVRLIGLMAQGHTWDENVYWSSGRNYLENLLALDFRASSWHWNYEHPPLTKYLAGLGALLADGFGPARVLFAMMSATTCVFAARIAQRLFSLRVGLLAGLTCALTPHLIAHGKVIGHETPGTLLWTAGLWVLMSALGADDAGDTRKSLVRFALAGLLGGLAVSVRYPNGLVFFLYVAIVAIWTLGRPGRGFAARAVHDLLGLTLAAAAAVLIFAMLWPRLWSHPYLHLHESLHKLSITHEPELFLGRLAKPGPSYFPLYLLATAPLGLLAGAGLFVWRSISIRSRSTWLLAVWLVIPFGVAWSPVVQDGVRYILPALVPLSIMAAAGFEHLASEVARRLGERARTGFFGITGALLLYLTIVCVRVHPYYLDYYGEQVGGPAVVQAHRWFEVGWWGEGLTEAFGWVDDHAPPHTRVSAHVTPNHLTWRRGDLWTEPLGDRDGDIVVQNHFAEAPMALPGWTTLYEVKVMGAVLARVSARPGLDLSQYSR